MQRWAVRAEASRFTPSAPKTSADPDFDEMERAFYYARVLEIPTPRWSEFDKLGLEPNPDLPMTIVERAYTSPIWYTP